MHKIPVVKIMLDALEYARKEFRYTDCSCDGEYTEEGRLVGHACYYHRIEHVLEEAIDKAKSEKI